MAHDHVMSLDDPDYDDGRFDGPEYDGPDWQRYRVRVRGREYDVYMDQADLCQVEEELGKYRSTCVWTPDTGPPTGDVAEAIKLAWVKYLQKLFSGNA